MVQESRVGLRAGLLILAFVFVSAIHASASDSLRSQREAAVIEARNGNPKAALVELQSLLQQYPDDSRLLADATIVANWAGSDELALDLFGRAATPKDDSGVVEAAARSARNLHKYGVSAELYRRAQGLEPARWQPQLGEAMTFTDTGDYGSAARLMQPLLRTHGEEKDVILGEAYLCSRQGDFACSIAMDERYIDKFQKNAQVRSDLALALSGIGSQTMASAYYGAEVAPEDSAAKIGLNGSAGGEEVRWGENYAPIRAQQRADSLSALARLDSVVAATAPTERAWRFAQFDRIVALHDLQEMQKVLDLYDSLKMQKLGIPAYALRNVADAYLTLRRPERAEDIFRDLLKQDPADGRLWSSLAYAQMESEHLDEALATIDKAYKQAPVWIKSAGGGALRPNRLRLDLESQAAQMRHDVGFLAEEQKRLEYLVAAAPGNAHLHWQLASCYLARGWVVRALKELRIANGYASPDELPSLDAASIDEDAGLRDAVDAMIPVLQIRETDSPALKRFLTDEGIERGWQLDAETVFGWGNGVEVGSSDQHSEAHVSGPLFDNRWRIFGQELSDSGTFEVGSAERTRAGAGLRYNYNRQEAWAEFAHDTGTNRNAGNIGTKLYLNDFWTLRAEADSDSFDVPVRAVTGDVHGRSLTADLEWHANELRDANVGFERLLFSDGNQRSVITAAGDQRVWTTPRLVARIGAEEWASSNSLNENRPYFNPSRDFSLGPRGSLDWLTWRRYERSFHQEVNVQAAPYYQQNYGTGGAFSVHYGQRWKTRTGLEWRWGVTWNTQPYDGINEYRTALDSGITWGQP
ncbi:MAG: poly-beta-1,6 N-acetyl-D-glucosamine export porin PgaA [Terracidiphilus sp.]|jgi:biofilm PGA synthesis protein PgaA